MPTVPQGNRRVRNSVLPGARVNTQVTDEVFGGGQGVRQIEQASQNLLQTTTAIYQEEAKKANRSVNLNVNSKFKRDFGELMTNPETGYLSVKGKAAAEKFKDYEDKFDNLANTYLESLATDEQRDMFKQDLRNYKEDFVSKSQGHIFNETTAYNNQETEANIKINQEYAVKNYTAPGEVGKSLKSQEALIDEMGERNGLPKEQIELEKLKARSSTHLNVLNQMVNDDKYKTAKAYVSAIGDQVSSETKEAMLNLVEKSSIKGDSIEMSDQIIGQGLKKHEALAEARKIEDPDRRDAVVARVKSRYSEMEAFEKEEQFSTYNSIGKHILDGGSLDNLPTAQVMKLSYKQLKEFQEFERKQKSGITPNTDLNVHYELEQLAAEKPDAFKSLPLTQYLNKLAPSDFKKFSRLQAGLRGKDQEAISELDGIRTKKDIVNQTLNELGIEYGSRANQDDNKKANQFRERIDNVVIEKQRELGRKLNNNELNDIVDELRTDVVLDNGLLWNTTKKSFEIGIEDLEDADLDSLDEVERNNILFSVQRNMKYEDIPKEEASKISEALQRNGMSATREKIVQYYFKNISKKAKING